MWHTRGRGRLPRLHPRKLFSSALYGRYKPPGTACCATRSETPLRLLEEIQRHAPGVFRGLRRCACRHRQGETVQAVAAGQEGRADRKKESEVARLERRLPPRSKDAVMEPAVSTFQEK